MLRKCGVIRLRRPKQSEHEEILIDLYKKKVPINEIAITLKRTENGIKARLRKLGLMDR